MRAIVEKSLKSRKAGLRKFHPDCLPFIFSDEELEILENKGYRMKSLWEGKQYPITREEKSFVRFCKCHSGSFSIMESAWMKYLNRHELEASLFQTDEIYKEYSRVRRENARA